MGIRISGYEVISELGEGGMCIVYLARHEAFDELVAVKVLHEQYSRQEEMRARFLNEARIMRGLKHENIVDVRDFLTFDDRVALVMDYIEGTTLNHVIGRVTGPIPYERAFPLFRQILAAVTHAHSKGIVHRDLKPSNVMVDQSGHVWVTDFGIAKVMGSGGLTRTGAKLGTLYYMSPEQIRGARDVDHRSDIYSLGMTLYEMLAGRLPFDSDGDTSEFAIMDAIVREDLPDPRSFYPHIPEWLVHVIGRAMAKEPESRLQSCEEFLEALDAGTGGSDGPASVRSTAEVVSPRPEPVGYGSGSVGSREYAGVPSSVSRQGRFSRDSSGVITHAVTGLQWLVGPDMDMDWNRAESWVEGLGVGWRLHEGTFESARSGLRLRAPEGWRLVTSKCRWDQPPLPPSLPSRPIRSPIRTRRPGSTSIVMRWL